MVDFGMVLEALLLAVVLFLVGALGTGLFISTVAETQRGLKGDRDGFYYSRITNPTTRQLELTLAGMQGTAAAYDLAKFASPAKIIMGDVSLAQAEHNAHRVNTLVGEHCCDACQVDALDASALLDFL